MWIGTGRMEWSLPLDMGHKLSQFRPFIRFAILDLSLISE